jgi:hypothetical protein
VVTKNGLAGYHSFGAPVKGISSVSILINPSYAKSFEIFKKKIG